MRAFLNSLKAVSLKNCPFDVYLVLRINELSIKNTDSGSIRLTGLSAQFHFHIIQAVVANHAAGIFFPPSSDGLITFCVFFYVCILFLESN